ncbi:MAG: HEAT repeat domain-containing protein [Erythrobacter sp.]|uniref:HEAT repeat domain-containing protein n=1 Tax=Erythrobacter sp. TaxID=1042 RepID=UPI0025DD513A|nr:HEAT repeat domain-containing protein [Erythrobacter sp.]MCL9998956.1 HEAT repeat domain-containing protein [Erythrobacter sp.]
MSEPVDWGALAGKLGTITPSEHGWSERGGTAVAYDAIEILGASVLREAVDFYVSGEPGFEVAKSVLMFLKPSAAMERCREIFRDPADPQQAADAIELLRMVADRRVLDWIPELMASENEAVRIWTLGILDQLLVMQESITPEEAAPIFKQALADPSDNVRSQASRFLENFAECEQVIAMRSFMQ